MALDFTIRKRADGWDYSADWHLDLPGIAEDGWHALFFNVLGCPEAEAWAPGEDAVKLLERNRERFQRALPGYPMLRRIWFPYRDVWYAPEEVGHLRAECLRVKAIAASPPALEALGQLLRACDEALRVNSGVFLVAN